MSIRIEFLGPILHPPLEVEVQSLEEIAQLLSDHPILAPWCQTCALALNGTLIRTLDTPLHAGDTLTLLPPVCGG